MESVKSKLELNFGTLKKQNAQESFTHRKLVGPIGQALDCCTAQINFAQNTTLLILLFRRGFF